MLISILKFIHLLSTLGLLGLAIYCLILVASKKFTLNQLFLITRLNKAILLLAFIALLTGTFLVYPKHFTFHTPWIQAAYTFLLIFCGGILSLILLRKKTLNIWMWYAIYFVAILILIGIIHDAVTKTTFLF